MDYKKRSARSSQQVEVMKKRSEIVALLEVCYPLAQIRTRVGLDGMSQSTFNYHASKLRAEAKSNVDRASRPDERQRQHDPAPTLSEKEPSEEKSEALESISKDDAPPQLKSVVPVKVVLDEPTKRVKRRKGGKITPDLSVKKDEYDISKWSSELK